MNKTGGDLHCPLPHRYLSNPAILPLIGGEGAPHPYCQEAISEPQGIDSGSRRPAPGGITGHSRGNGSRQSCSGAGAGGSGKALCVLTQSLSWTRGGGGDLMVVRDHMGTWATYVSTFHLQL